MVHGGDESTGLKKSPPHHGDENDESLTPNTTPSPARVWVFFGEKHDRSYRFMGFVCGGDRIMGSNSTMLVLNDALHLIREDEQFGQKVSEAISSLSLEPNCVGHVDISSGGHCNAASAIEQHHADGTRIVAVGGNTAQVLGLVFPYGDEPYDVRVLRALASELGYHIRKKKS